MISKLALDQLLDSGTVIISESNEESLEHAWMTSADDLVNLNQPIVREDTRQLRHGLDESEGTGTSSGTRRWKGLEQRPRTIPLHLERRSRSVGLLKVLTKLTHDLEPDSSLESDLVTDAHSFEG